MLAETLGHYRILRPLGKGGMGEVYAAQDIKLGRSVALKVLPQALAADSGRRERFEREARAVAALNHPHIVTIHSVEEADAAYSHRRARIGSTRRARRAGSRTAARAVRASTPMAAA